MSKLFGIYCPQGLSAQCREMALAVKGSWQKTVGGEFNHIELEHLILLQSEYHQYAQTAWIQEQNRVATLVGHPVISADRQADLKALIRPGYVDENQLQQAEGAYCLAHYNAVVGQLTLVTDPLGLRPFYFMSFAGGLIFASDLKSFQQLNIELQANHQGLCEYATLGYFLFDHTPYAQVKCARPGQILKLSEVSSTLSCYFDWQTLARQRQTPSQALHNIDRDFKQVCDKYLNQDDSVLTTLSGGLDSRLIACELLRRKKKIQALNFSQCNTQDLSCAQGFAQACALPLQVVQVDNTQAKSVEQRLGEHWRQQQPAAYHKVDRPQLAWSGNGGSVGLGFIYCSDSVYQAALSQDPEKLADAYLAQQFANLPHSVVQHASQHQKTLRANIVRALSEFTDMPLEKAYYLFLLLNDQHHHLAIPAEQVDEHQMEFCLPIYSWRVLRHILSLPVKEVRRHKFYLAWLKQSYPQALATPWQAYPGHIPCPLNIIGQDQWSVTHKQKPNNSLMGKIWLRAMRLRHRKLVKQGKLSLLCVLHLLKLKDASSQLKLVEKITAW